ncbi:MAG: hypothetical protein KGH64_03600, partial [Candidatus Micrarchaeota archaeon]|nr:hypothetical protein [Candidatus Micrarchaeota archaeon]
EPLAKQEIQNVISFMVTYFPPPNGKVATRKVHLDQFGAWVQNDNGAIHKLTNLQVSILGIPANLRVSIDATMEISNGRQITKGLFNMEGQECTLHFSKGPTGPVLLS